MPPTPPETGKPKKNLFEVKHEEAMQNAVNILSTLTFSRRRMFGDVVEAAAPMPEGLDVVEDVKAKSNIHKLLDKCWSKVEQKIMGLWWVSKVTSLFGKGAREFLSWAKRIILSDLVLKKLIPYYGAISGMIEGAIGLAQTYSQAKAVSELTETKLYLHEGYPIAALKGFVEYATKATAKRGAKGAYKFGMSVVSLIGQIFSFGWSSTVDFVAGLVEKLTEIAISIIEAEKFDTATEKLIEYRKDNRLPSGDDFEDMLESCPFLGCVFFAVADKIGPDHISYTFSPPGRFLSQIEIVTARNKLTGAINQARSYIKEAGITLSYRSAALKDRYGDPLKSTEAQYVGSRGMSSPEFALRNRRKLKTVKKRLEAA